MVPTAPVAAGRSAALSAPAPASTEARAAVEQVEDVLPEETWQLFALLAAAALGAWLVGVLIGVLVRRLARTSVVAADLSRRGRTPLRTLLVLIAVTVVLDAAPEVGDWRDPVVRVLGLALIATVGWLVVVAVQVVADMALARYDVDVVDNRHARRVRTQIGLLRRLAIVLVAILTVAAMLLTFPTARAAGAGILASAGVISIVAGLAAQTSLANVFAGLQLAFTDAIRVDDVVVVEDEWGRIEEITLTYVVVHIWDDRRLVLPSTYFTTTPFENWTRKESAVLGSVELDVDWTVPFDEMRTELHRLLEDEGDRGPELWDGRVGVLQVTDAVGSVVRARVLVSAQDAGTLFDLRCHVREQLVGWLQREHPAGLPRVRVEGTPAAPAAGRADRRAAAPSVTDSSLFTGSTEARERSRAFAGPSQEEVADRDTTPGPPDEHHPARGS
ncbi:mechanosensitive ion channel family protein [Blastococcus sp. SYSU DS0619]